MPESTDQTNKDGETDSSTGVAKVLNEIKEKLDKATEPREVPPVVTVPDRASERANWQKRLGFSDEQMTAHEEMIRRNNAPLVEEQGWSRLEQKPDLAQYRKEIEAELAIYSQENRNPIVMEKIYYMVKGRHAESRPATKEAPPVRKDTRVVDSRVSGGPGYSGTDGGTAGGDGSERPAEETLLSEGEKFVAEKLGITHEDYRKSRNAGKEIRELKVPDARPVSSLADIELKRMTGRR